MNTIRSICVYCGSSPGSNEAYEQAGRALGRAIAQAGLRLVYGGGTKGIMGAVSDEVMRAGGSVTGIIPRFLISKEATETSLASLDELVITENMHERKHQMFVKSDAFVALPGGIGTLEEIVEIMTWAQLGRHRKPFVFVNVLDFWNPMLALLDHMRAEGFVHSSHLVQPVVIDDAEAVVAALLTKTAADGTPSGGISTIIDKM